MEMRQEEEDTASCETLYPYRSGDEYGYIDAEGGVVLPAQWAFADVFYGGYAIAGNADKYGKGIIDRAGEYVVLPEYQIEYQNGLFVVRQDNGSRDLFGFYCPSEGLFLPPAYDYIDHHHASADADLIFTNQIVDQDAPAGAFAYKVGYIHKETGHVQIPFIYDEPADQAQFQNGYAIVAQAYGADDYGYELKFLLIDEDGVAVRFPEYVQVYVDAFHGISENTVIVQDKSTGLFGFATTEGTILCEPAFDSVSSFSEGYAAVSINGCWGHIDRRGEYAVSPRYRLCDEDGLMGGYQFKNGIALLHTPDGYMGIRANGEVLFAGFQADDIMPFSRDGFAFFQTHRKWGVLDASGAVIQPAQWDEITLEDAGTGLFPARMQDAWGYIDEKGVPVIGVQFDSAAPFLGGLAQVTEKGRMMYIDASGSLIWIED